MAVFVPGLGRRRDEALFILTRFVCLLSFLSVSVFNIPAAVARLENDGFVYSQHRCKTTPHTHECEDFLRWERGGLAAGKTAGLRLFMLALFSSFASSWQESVFATHLEHSPQSGLECLCCFFLAFLFPCHLLHIFVYLCNNLK